MLVFNIGVCAQRYSSAMINTLNKNVACAQQCCLCPKILFRNDECAHQWCLCPAEVLLPKDTFTRWWLRQITLLVLSRDACAWNCLCSWILLYKDGCAQACFELMAWWTSIVFLTKLFFNQSFKCSGPLKPIKNLPVSDTRSFFGLSCHLMRLLIVYGLCKRCGHWKIVGWSPGSLWSRESTESTVLQEGSIMKWEHANIYTE